MKILCVCLGNICRSPTAEAAIREAAGEAGLDVQVDSAGTAAYHVGNKPDERSRAVALEMGLHVDGRARQAMPEDFENFDLILAMDSANERDLRRIAPSEEARSKLRMFREFDDRPGDGDVPDPYYGGVDGFHEVVEICRRSAAGLVTAIQTGSL